MREAVIVSTARTPIGKAYRGAFNDTQAQALVGHVIGEAVKRAGIEPGEVEDVVIGAALQQGSTGFNIARQGAMRAGLPVSVSGMSVDRQCASGMMAIATAAKQIMHDGMDVAVGGGVESISLVQNEKQNGYRAVDPWLWEHMPQLYMKMIETAEIVAERYQVSREDQDRFAYESQQKAIKAIERNVFAEQIVPIPVEKVRWEGTTKHVTATTFARDELPRAETTLEGLAKLRPAFKPTGTVTAGNASPYSDGSAAVIVMNREKAEASGIKPIARLVTYAVAGIDPDIMGVGPILAIPKALKKAGLTLDQIDLIEFNEAFAAQALAVARELKMDLAKVNVNGGAIALGHPLGATGAKLTAQLVHELRKRGGGLGMVTMCVGGGMGAAGIFEVYGA
ncbi:MAG TPA: thiolase family protein [Beijerinckiaceae bacterium]|nr:thiolase family protein [Beijerinckiaceae bacterium]